MNIIEAIEHRRAIKGFDPDFRMPEADVERLMRLAMLSPTAFNIQNWRFVLARNSELRQQIRAAAWDQAQVTDASLLVILTADLKSWEKEPGRYWKEAPEPVRDFLVPAIGHYYDGREQVQRDEAMRSCGMAAMTLMLAAREMGYDSCPMDGFDFDAVGKLINLPADHTIAMFVAIGKPLLAPLPRGGQLTMREIVVADRFA
jgi:nitroreductase